MDLRYLALIAVILGLIVSPVMAGTKYMSGGPDISASLSGSNEFSPGQDTTLAVKIENKGLIDIKFVQSGIVDRDDLPNTAKLVSVSLSPGEAPLVIKSDPQNVGDIPGGKSATASFAVKITSDAAAGTYLLPLTVKYTYLSSAEQIGQDSIQYIYKDVEKTIALPVSIEPRVILDVVSVEPEYLNVGNEGYLHVKVQNVGSETGESTIIKIARNGNSPLIPTDSSVYIGNISPGESVDCTFKVSVSRDATAQTYPVDLLAVYQNHEGDTVTSDPVTVGVPVGGKVSFEVISAPGQLTPGVKKVIEVEYQNTGDTTAYNAQARISAIDPFTSNDDTAFLGDLAPGSTATARYEVSVDQAAVTKEYGLDSEIRYRDALDNSQISDTMKVQVRVIPGESPLPLIIGIVVLLGVIGGIGYYVYQKRKKN
jgi:hypothetical protein